jgi:flagellar biosynthesis protein FlhG
MRSQADKLKQLVAKRVLGIVGAKEKVGLSTILYNIAAGLTERIGDVIIINASSRGIPPFWGVEQIPDVPVAERLLNGEYSLRATPVPTSYDKVKVIDFGEIDLARVEDPAWVRERIRKYFQRVEENYPFVLIDLGTLSSVQSAVFSMSCPELMFVLTPSPEARAQCYATIKSMLNSDGSFREVSIALLVNMVEGPDQALLVSESIADTARKFLDFDLSTAGYVPLDRCVDVASENKQPFLVASPESLASQTLKEVVDWIYGNRPSMRQIGVSDIVVNFFDLLIEIQDKGEENAS